MVQIERDRVRVSAWFTLDPKPRHVLEKLQPAGIRVRQHVRVPLQGVRKSILRFRIRQEGHRLHQSTSGIAPFEPDVRSVLLDRHERARPEICRSAASKYECPRDQQIDRQ